MVAKNEQTGGELVVRDFDGKPVRQRASDGAFDLTSICAVSGKRLGNYLQLDGTKDYLNELSVQTGKPVSELVKVSKGGRDSDKGTWGHRLVAIHVTAWCSPRLHVQIIRWGDEILTTGRAEMPGHPGLSGETLTAGNVLAMLAEERRAREEQNRHLLEVIQAMRAPALGGPTHAGPFCTVEFRLAVRRPEWKTTRKQRARVSEKAKKYLFEATGEYPDKYNRDNAFYSHHLFYLDMAIDTVYRESRRAGQVEDWGLLSDVN